MRIHAIRAALIRLGATVPAAMMLAAPASAASFTLSPDWPNYLLVASIAVLALGVTVRVLEGRDLSRRSDFSPTPDGSIDVYRNRVLKP